MRALFGPPPPVAARWHPVPGLAGCATPSRSAMAPKRPKLALLVHSAVGPPRNVLLEARPRYCSVTREAPVQSQCGIAPLFRGVVMFLSEVRSPVLRYSRQDGSRATQQGTRPPFGNDVIPGHTVYQSEHSTC